MFDESDIEEINDQIEKLVNQVHALEVKAGFKINRVYCTVCNTELESKFTHDFQECGCENKTFCDGGTEYQRIGGKDLSKIQIWRHDVGFEEMKQRGL